MFQTKKYFQKKRKLTYTLSIYFNKNPFSLFIEGHFPRKLQRFSYNIFARATLHCCLFCFVLRNLQKLLANTSLATFFRK